MTELHHLTATDALRAFRAREVSPVDLMTAIVERADAVEPQVNAFAERMVETSLAAARDAETRYAPGGDPPRALEGLPVAAKESQPIIGHTVTDGTLLHDGVPSVETAISLERIAVAGGIIHARTTTAEFCCMPISHTRRWGITRNPWNLAASAGGSSGGAAASLAAGTSMLAVGSDIGGSIRVPSSFNGVVGFKPPYGRNALLPPGNLDTYQHEGPLARTVADCALLQSVMAGPHPRDVASLRPALRIPEALEGIDGLRIGFSEAPGDFPIDPEVRANTRAAAQALRAEGATVEEIALPLRLDDVKRALWGHFGSAWARGVLELAQARPGGATPYTLAFAEKGVETAGLVDPQEGQRIEVAIYTVIGALLERFDALIVPTIGALAFEAGNDYVEAPLVVDGVAMEHFSDPSLTPVFNICSRCPVVAVPSGWASNGVPTGVQVVARTYDDVMAFRVAAAVERVGGGGWLAAGGRVPAFEALTG